VTLAAYPARVRRSEDDFSRARRDLLRSFGSWRPDTAVHDDAGLLVDFKYSYGDGEFLRWTCDDVEEFMLSWVPRKVVLPDDELAELTAIGIRDFLTFLGETGRLAPGSDPLHRLLAAVARCTPEMIRRAADPAFFGMAKALLVGGDPFDEPAPHTVLPARPEADREAARAIAAGSPAFRRLCILHDYFSEPRRLTQKGNLTLADARHLVDALDTGDRIDETIGDTRFSTRSSAELIGLVTIVGFAKRAGVLRRYAGKLVAVKSWARKRAHPLETTLRLADLMIDIGPFAFRWSSGGDRDLSLVEASIPSLMAALYGAPMAFDQLAERVVEVARDQTPNIEWEQRLIERMMPVYLEWAVTHLEDLGLVAWQQAETYEEYGREHRRGGTLVATGLGVYWCQTRLQEYGFAVPIGDEVALDDPDEAIVGALAAVLESDGPDVMMAGLMEMGDPGPVGARVERWWKVGHPSTAEVLGAIEDRSPSAAVRRAAHRALFRHRNLRPSR
jgi:hypothetical protein